MPSLTRTALRQRLANTPSIPPAPSSGLHLRDNRVVSGVFVFRDERCAVPQGYFMRQLLTTAALINHTWAENPALLELPINRVIAGLMTGIMWLSSGWYLKNGVYSIGAVVAAMGGVQVWSVFA